MYNKKVHENLSKNFITKCTGNIHVALCPENDTQSSVIIVKLSKCQVLSGPSLNIQIYYVVMHYD